MSINRIVYFYNSKNGSLAQMARALLLQGRGQGFEALRIHKIFKRSLNGRLSSAAATACVSGSRNYQVTGGKILGEEAQKWQAPTMSDGKSPGVSMDVHQNHHAGGKLNPRWVETLMGLPIGWVMPSCTNPVIIVPTNLDFLEME